MTDNDIILHLSLINGIGIQTITRLNQSVSILNALYSLSINSFLSFGLSLKISEKLFYGLKNKEELIKEKELLEKNRITYISFLEEFFPPLLKEIPSHPVGIYILGEISLLQKKMLTIVSSRKTTEYGKKCIFNIISQMREDNELNQIVSVSGGAIGGDTFIHEASLKYNIKTISILGSGLLHLYPKQNLNLFQNIIENGGIILSPFSLQTTASPYTFPNRNYILAGISKATLVIEADQKSGTLITANAALEFNRSVGSIPGSIFSNLSLGSNELLNQGAFVVTSSNDLRTLLDMEIKPNELLNKINREVSEIIITEKIDAFQELHRIAKKDFIDIAILAEKTELPLSVVENYLFELMIKDEAQQDFIGQWKITK